MTGDQLTMKQSEAKELYHEFCKNESELPIFALPKWLDLVCPEKDWQVVVHKKGNKILAALPFIVKKKWGVRLISTPRLTQFAGIFFSNYTGKYANKLKREKKSITYLMDALPKHHAFFQCFHFSFKNWIPLYWLGFEQTTKYTYVISDLSSTEKIWKDTTENLRSTVRKAEKQLTLRTDLSVEEFYRVMQLTYRRQNLEFPHSLEYIKNIIETSIEGGFGRMQFILDEENKTHAVLFLVWNEYACHYLFGGTDPDLKNSGAGALNVWEAIKFSGTVSKRFDFEGSMVENIERFFRSFGAVQEPYFRIRKFNSIGLGILSYIQRRRSGKI